MTGKRKVTNFLLTPRFQLKLTYYYIAVGLSIVIATGSGVFMKMAAVRDIMNNAVMTDFGQQGEINSLMFDVVLISLAGFVLFAVASFIFALMVSHRVAGPVLAINAYIDELRKGNYDYGRKLRPNDELTSVMDNLHGLSAALRERAGDS